MPGETAAVDGAAPAAAPGLGFLGGLRCLLQGLRLAYGGRHRLARYWLAPGVLAFFLVVGSWLLCWTLSDQVVGLIWSEPALGAWGGVTHALWRLTAVVVFLAAAGLIAISSVTLFTLLTLPVNDLFSEKVEGILGTWAPRPFSVRFLVSDVGAGMRYALARFFLKLLWLVPLFFLSLFVPVLGQAVYLLVGGYFLCKYTGLDYVDWCAARRGMGWQDRLAFGKAHRLAICGFGAGVVLSLLVPLLFVVVWPGAVAGGTILFLELQGLTTDAQVRRVLEVEDGPGPRGT
jgi:CysZ protein